MTSAPILNLTCVMLLCCGVLADTVVLRDGSRLDKVSIAGVDAEAVHVKGGEPIRRGNVVSVSRDVFTVPTMCGSVTLRDGTHLTGALGKFNAGKITFRSVTFGTIEIPVAEIARISYLAAPLRDVPDKPGATLIHRDRHRNTGQLMWADAKSVGLLTPSGLSRTAVDGLAGVIMADAPDRAAVVLRNGDRLPRLQKTDGSTISCDLLGKNVQVQWEAIKTLFLSPDTKD